MRMNCKRIVSFAAVLCLLLTMLPMSVLAANADVLLSAKCGDNATAVLTADGTLTVSGTGPMWDYIDYDEFDYHEPLPWEKHRDRIYRVVINDGVTKIGAHAFWGCSKLRDVSFGNTVQEIGHWSFVGCKSLRGIALPESLTAIMQEAFSNSGLTEVTIPKSVTWLEGFSRCEQLEKIVIKSNPDNGFFGMSMSVFMECPKLKTIIVEEGHAALYTHEGALYNGSSLVQYPLGRTDTSFTVREGTTEIGQWAISKAAYLEKVTIPYTVKAIQSFAFNGCAKLKTVIFEGEAPEYIDAAAFRDVTADVHYPADSKTWTADKLQDYDGDLTWIADKNMQVKLPEIMTKQLPCGENVTAFLDENGTLTVSGTGPMWDFREEEGWDYDYHGPAPWEECYDKIRRAVIEDGVTKVGANALSYCSDMEQVTMGKDVEIVGAFAFFCCEKLQSVQLSDAVTEIGQQAFYGTAITELTLPATMHEIGLQAFGNCAALETITFQGEAPEYFNGNAFDFVTANVYYPANSTTWTEEYRRDYGGSLTWIADESIVLPTPTQPAKLVMAYTDAEGYCEEWKAFGEYTEHFYPALLIGDELYPIDPAAVYSSDAGALSVVPSSEYEGAVYVWALADYSEELRYDHSDGKTYSFTVKPVMPTVGIYSKPEANGGSYLRDFTATKGNNTLYLILRDGWTIEDLSPEHFATDCSYVITPDKTMAVITIGSDAVAPAYPYLVITVVDDLGYRQDYTHRFDLTTAFCDLYFRYPAWDNGPAEDFSTEPVRQWNAAKGDQTVCYFYFNDGTEEILITPDRLRSTDDAVVRVSPYAEGSGAAQLDVIGFGSAEIEYEHDGAVYALPVRSALPEYGFYTAPTASEAAFVEDDTGFTITKDNRTVYLVLGDSVPDYTIASIDLFRDKDTPFPEDSYYTIAADKRSAAITIGSGAKGESYYNLFFELNIPEYGGTDIYSKRLVVVRSTDDAKPIPTPTPPVQENPFTDVVEEDYFYAPVLWAVDKSVTTGTSATTFSPDASCTRAQVVTFLWRANGSPAPKSANNPFADVPADAYYTKAVLWAVEQGITSGTGATTFSPDAPCTRAQVATFLWRAEGKPAAGGSNPFVDVAAGQYYYDAVLWCVAKGVTTGTSATTFAPDATCIRGQIVTFLYRALK